VFAIPVRLFVYSLHIGYTPHYRLWLGPRDVQLSLQSLFQTSHGCHSPAEEIGVLEKPVNKHVKQ
jgi:hypothetical protein